MKIQIKAPVAILGFGNEGRAAYKFLKNQGISEITICDQNKKVDTPKETLTILGEYAFDELDQFETIVRSPGVHYDTPGILKARDQGVKVTSLTQLTLEIGRENLTAITGSNGKTSTIGMVEAILNDHYHGKLIVGGNDRSPILEEALAKKNTPLLMEVSSFQFADLKASPHIAAILNISPNHLDWHENMEDYIHAKKNLIAHQGKDDWAVLNANDVNSAKLAAHAPGHVFWVGKKEGISYAMWEGGNLIAKSKDQEKIVLSKDDLKIKTHPDNVAFAVAIALLHNVSIDEIKKSLVSFNGVEHRLEFVRDIDGIKFYNDSACTTPESAWVAIQQFTEGKLILMLGGSSKNADFKFLAGHIAETRTRVYLYGEEADNLRKTIEIEGGSDLILDKTKLESFIEMIQETYNAAGPNDVVILSPACASFDMFKDSKDRGKQFKDIVKSL